MFSWNKGRGSYISWRSWTAPTRSRSALQRVAKAIFSAPSIKQCPSHTGLGRVLKRAATTGLNQEEAANTTPTVCSAAAPRIHQLYTNPRKRRRTTLNQYLGESAILQVFMNKDERPR
jgi:hypothetical protein